jgi:hypothetical protein
MVNIAAEVRSIDLAELARILTGAGQFMVETLLAAWGEAWRE